MLVPHHALRVGLRVFEDPYAWHPAGFPIGDAVAEEWIHDTDLPCELLGSGHIATGSVRKSAAF